MVDVICPEFLKALHALGLSWLTRIYNFAWRSGVVTLDWQTGVVVPIFGKGLTGGCAPTIGGSHSSASPEKSMPGCWQEESLLVEPWIKDTACSLQLALKWFTAECEAAGEGSGRLTDGLVLRLQ